MRYCDIARQFNHRFCIPTIRRDLVQCLSKFIRRSNLINLPTVLRIRRYLRLCRREIHSWFSITSRSHDLIRITRRRDLLFFLRFFNFFLSTAFCGHSTSIHQSKYHADRHQTCQQSFFHNSRSSFFCAIRIQFCIHISYLHVALFFEPFRFTILPP